VVSDLVPIGKEFLTPAEFQKLEDVPPELEWLANITNPKTRHFYKSDVEEFSRFVGLEAPAELRSVARAHVIAWRKSLESRNLNAATIRRKLSALSSLYEYLCERNAVSGNPVNGVKRPAVNSNEGSTPALGEAQARRLLEAPPLDTLKGVMDRAIFAALLYHGIRREELCLLCLGDMQTRQGVMHLKVRGKRSKIRYVPMHKMAQRLIQEYLTELAKHGGGLEDSDAPLFRPVRNNRTGTLEKPLHPSAIYKNIVTKYGRDTGINIEVNGLCVHSMRATAATNALKNKAEMAKVQEWLGTRTSPPPASTTAARASRRTARHFM